MRDRGNMWERLLAAVGLGLRDECHAVGRYHAEFREYAGGPVVRVIDFPNLVVNVGKNALLTEYLKGSAWTTGTVYMGLVTSSGYTGPVAGDTMSSHSGWAESTTYGSTRSTVTFGTASSGSLASSSIGTFTSTGSDTIEGAFIVVGGTSAEGNTTGTLFSMGAFGTAQPWISGNTLTVSYTISV